MSETDGLIPRRLGVDRIQRQRHLDQLLTVVRHTDPQPDLLTAVPVIVQPTFGQERFLGGDIVYLLIRFEAVKS